MMKPDRQQQRRWLASLALGLLVLAGLLALPRVARSDSRIDWTQGSAPGGCSSGNQCPDTTVEIDGTDGPLLSAGTASLDEHADGQGHVASFTTTDCTCVGASPYEDFTLDVSNSDDSEGGGSAPSMEAASGLELGDNCPSQGRGYVVVIPPPVDDDCRRKEDQQDGTPVSLASGQMSTLPQLDFQIQDPFSL